MSATLGGNRRHITYILRSNPVTAVAFAGAGILVLVAMLAPWLVPYDPIASDVKQALQPPSAAHWAGTDQLGRDIFSRIISATRLDLVIAISAVGLSFAAGAVIGGFCGYSGGRLDRWVGRVVDVLMAFPLFVLAMALVAALGNRVENIIIATAVINLPFYVRFARAEVNVRRNAGWVEAARACGESHLSVVLRVLLPNVLPAMAVQISLNLGWAISECGRAELHRARRHGADAGMGYHGRRGRTLHHHRQMVAGGDARPGADAHGALLQPARRWAARHPGPPDAQLSLLQVDGLRVAFATRHGPVEALRGIDLAVAPGESLGVVGESGSGKSVTSLAIMRLLDRAGRITQGTIRFGGQDITRAGYADLRRLRGAAVSMIFQNPRVALNPIRSVERQIADVLRAHGKDGDMRAQALDLLRAVEIRDPERRLNAYPHELSGGMCQRVMIAMAIACEPALLIADEPTTGLDVTTQQTVMALLAALQSQRKMAMILITHDLGLAAHWCDRIAVMEQGQVVETGPTAELFEAPLHAYTQRLVSASPTRNSTLDTLTPAAFNTLAPTSSLHSHARVAGVPAGTPALLELTGLSKAFDAVKAVDDVSFVVPPGGALGLVGESGSGKSTLSRLVSRLIDADCGDILFHGESIGAIPARDFHAAPARKQIQIVFQDPHDSLNPRHTAYDSIAHPLRRLEHMRDGAALNDRVRESARRAGLPDDLLHRFPHQLSGGQKARIGIARAIAPRPRLLILDEPTAALDVSVQAVVLQLLDRLRQEDGIGLLFVSHDLNVVRMLCEDLVVLRAGRVVEAGPAARIFAAPRAAYTRELLAAIPYFEPSVARKR